MAEETVPGMAEAVEGRRTALHLSPGAFAREAGLTMQGLAPVRNGMRRAYQDKVRAGVARALHWPTDWYDRLLAGDDWTSFPDTEHPNGPRSDTDRITALEARVSELGQVVSDLAVELRRQDP